MAPREGVFTGFAALEGDELSTRSQLLELGSGERVHLDVPQLRCPHKQLW